MLLYQVFVQANSYRTQMLQYSNNTNLVPIQSQLTEPFKSRHISTARLDHLFNHIPGMHLDCNKSYNLLPLDLGQVTTNHLWKFVQHGDLHQKCRYWLFAWMMTFSERWATKLGTRKAKRKRGEETLIPWAHFPLVSTKKVDFLEFQTESWRLADFYSNLIGYQPKMVILRMPKRLERSESVFLVLTKK